MYFFRGKPFLSFLYEPIVYYWLIAALAQYLRQRGLPRTSSIFLGKLNPDISPRRVSSGIFYYVVNKCPEQFGSQLRHFNYLLSTVDELANALFFHGYAVGM